MYKSHLQHAIGSHAMAVINDSYRAQIWDVKPCEETNGMAGLLVCSRSPYGEDLSETYTDQGMQFYDLGEFIPTQDANLYDY